MPGFVGLQLLQQPGGRLGLRLPLGAHARSLAADELDIDERSQVVDDDDDRPRVEAGRVDRGAEDERRPVVQGFGLAVRRVDEGLGGPLLRHRVDAHARGLDQEADVLCVPPGTVAPESGRAW